MSGWIKLHRALKEWQWYDDHNATRLLIHLLVSVNYEDKKWKGCTIQAGSMAYSWDTLSNTIGLSVQQTRTAMDKLKSSSEVTIKTTNKYQVLTLCKWGELQHDNKQVTSKLTDKQQSNNNQITTTKEEKKDNKLKKQEEDIDILSEFDFSFFWDLYDKKVGDKEKLKKSYDNLKEETKFKIFKHVEQYKLSQPDKKFRKNPSTYINQKSWNDEIITSTSTKQPTESYTSKLSNW